MTYSFSADLASKKKNLIFYPCFGSSEKKRHSRTAIARQESTRIIDWTCYKTLLSRKPLMTETNPRRPCRKNTSRQFYRTKSLKIDDIWTLNGLSGVFGLSTFESNRWNKTLFRHESSKNIALSIRTLIEEYKSVVF